MEKSKRLLIFIAIVAVITISTLAFAALNGDLRFLSPNLDVVPDFSDIVESPRQMTYPLTMDELPEYFNASVIIVGSFYTGQTHTVYVQINHTRPDTSIWLAAGNYSLDIELSEAVKDNIANGSFSSLRNTDPFVSPGYPWIPTILAGTTYNLVLSLDNLVWTMVEEYTITSSAGAGGSISPSGSFVFLGGESQEFIITPDTGYQIEYVILNGNIICTDPIVTITINANYSIHATFSLIDYTITASADAGGSISPDGANFVPYGESLNFIITPNLGYAIEDVLVDLISVGPVTSYLFETVTENHTIHASFESIYAHMEAYEYVELVQTDYFDFAGVEWNGDIVYDFIPGTPIENYWFLYVPWGQSCYNVTYMIEVERVLGGDRTTVVSEKTLVGPWPETIHIQITETFNAPPSGEWVTILTIIDSSDTP